MSALLSWCSLERRCLAALFPLTLTLCLRERTPRTMCAPCTLEPTHGPPTPSLSPSEGERVPEGRERRRFMGSLHDFSVAHWDHEPNRSRARPRPRPRSQEEESMTRTRRRTKGRFM